MRELETRDVDVPLAARLVRADQRVGTVAQFDLEIGRHAIRACQTDRLEDTVDYAAVVRLIQDVLAAHRFHLLEPLAESLADHILKRFDANWIRLEVMKAGIVPGARFVGVRIERSR